MIYVYYVALDYQLKVKQLNYNHAFFTLRYLALTKTSMIFKIVNCLRLKSTKHRENIFPGSGCSEWIGSTDPVDRMSPCPSQLRSRSIHLE